jgi:hypothetical protein
VAVGKYTVRIIKDDYTPLELSLTMRKDQVRTLPTLSSMHTTASCGIPITAAWRHAGVCSRLRARMRTDLSRTIQSQHTVAQPH